MDAQLYTSSTSLSSSSSSSSRKASEGAAFFNDLIHDKKKQKRRYNRSCSFGLGSVEEEQDDYEEFEATRFPQIRMPSDDFDIRETKFSSRATKQKKTNRRLSLSPHGTRGLPRVEEVQGDDDENRNKYVFKLGLMLDRNEFNRKFRPHYQRPSVEIPILEEASENVKEPAQPQYRMSPTYKLKVDEIDFNTEKKQWPPEPEIEVIEEEKPEYDANAKEKEMFQQINKKLLEERDFIKKISKGELMLEEDLAKKQQCQTMFGDIHWNLVVQEAEEITSSDEDQQ